MPIDLTKINSELMVHMAEAGKVGKSKVYKHLYLYL